MSPNFSSLCYFLLRQVQFVKVCLDEQSYTVGENIDHIMDAAARVGATSRGK